MGETIHKTLLAAPGASADALFQLGLKLSTGGGSDGHEPDPTAALALFDLAARFGSIEAKIYHHELSVEMDPADVAEARQLAREWLAGV